MSSCQCAEKKKPYQSRNWVVLLKRLNVKCCAPSDFSTVECRSCGISWRTKAKYIDELKEIKLWE